MLRFHSFTVFTDFYRFLPVRRKIRTHFRRRERILSECVHGNTELDDETMKAPALGAEHDETSHIFLVCHNFLPFYQIKHTIHPVFVGKGAFTLWHWLAGA